MQIRRKFYPDPTQPLRIEVKHSADRGIFITLHVQEADQTFGVIRDVLYEFLDDIPAVAAILSSFHV